MAQESGHPLMGQTLEERPERMPAMDLPYQEVYTMNKTEARRLLIQTYLRTGSIAQTARLWQTSRQVVRTWVRRWQAQGEAGLLDRSRRPHSCPRQTPPAVEAKVVQLERADWLWQGAPEPPPVAGGERSSLPQHHPPHPAQKWPGSAAAPPEGLLPCPLGLGDAAALRLSPGGRQRHPR